MHQNLANRIASGPGWLWHAVLGLVGGIAAPLEPQFVPVAISRDHDALMDALRRREDQLDSGQPR